MPLAHGGMRPQNVHLAHERRTPADYARALAAAGGCATKAAALLGCSVAAVSLAAKRHGLRVNPRGGQRRDIVCWIDSVVSIGEREFVALHTDVGTKHLAELLDVSKPAVSQRLRRARDAEDA